MPWAEATTHVLTHSLHYGSAVFEGIRCYHNDENGQKLRVPPEGPHGPSCPQHENRGIPFERTSEELCEATLELIRANELPACYIRPLVYYGYGNMGVNPAGCPVEAIIAVWPWGAYLGPEALEKGIKMGTSSWRQRSINAIPPSMKSAASYMNSILAKQEAISHGYDEAVMLNEAGKVCEGTGENLFVVRDGYLSTPPLSDGLLEGVTRDTVMVLASDMDIPVFEESTDAF